VLVVEWILGRRVVEAIGEVGVEPVGGMIIGWRVLLLHGNCIPVVFR
jgi:hypothetical protein